MQTVTQEERPAAGATFGPAPAGIHPDPCARWAPFGDSAEAWLSRAFEFLPRGRRVEEPEALRAVPAPPHCAPGLHTLWPRSAPMLGAAWRLLGREPELASVYPWFDPGRPQRVELERVCVWPSGVEAQLSVRLGRQRLSVFDTLFAAGRRRYRAGECYDFVLTGLALAAWRPVPSQYAKAGLRGMLGRLGAGAPASPDPYLEPSGAGCECAFRGLVLETTPVQEVLGQPAWLLNLCLGPPEEGPRLDVLVTRLVWQGARAPEAGEVVEGRLWLQGNLAEIG